MEAQGLLIIGLCVGRKRIMKNGGKFLSDNDLRKEFTQLKKQFEYSWLNDISNDVTKQSIKDACIAYQRFFKGYAKFPKFKSKKRSKDKFYQDTNKIDFTRTHVKLEKISDSKRKNRKTQNWIRLAERDRIPFGENVKYINPRVSFDGLNWFVSVGVEVDESFEKEFPSNEGVGIDLGIKDLAICSDGFVKKNINKTAKVKQLEKKRCRLQRKISNKYEKNREGGSYRKTCNIIKSEKSLLKLNKRLTGIRHNYQHQTTTDIVNRKPMFITIENLNISDMMKNRHLSKAIQNQSLYEFTRQLKYKCLWSGIELRQVDRFYPSSKMCSCCGNIKKDLKLSDRTYICKECGYVEDRDLNASYNLRDAVQYEILA